MACWIPRPAAFGAAVQLDLPRSAVGVNEYIYALSLRHPEAVRCAAGPPSPTHLRRQRRPCCTLLTARACARVGRAGGRLGDSRWELSPGAAGLRGVTVKLHQQYETPAAVVELVRRQWQPNFDAMATPFSAVCAAYATLEDDVLRADAVPRDSVVYVNPAYAPTDALNGAAGIELFLAKLIETDVQTRGCTLIALLPNLHAPWHERFVGRSHEVHHVVGQLVFENPMRNLRAEKPGYLWQRSYILCVWRPEAPPSQPAWHYAHLEQPSPACQRIQLRLCRKCARVRVLPRWADPTAGPLREGAFECSANPDSAYASCEVPEFLPVYMP